MQKGHLAIGTILRFTHLKQNKAGTPGFLTWKWRLREVK